MDIIPQEMITVKPSAYRVSTITCNASITTTIYLQELFEYLSLGDNVGFIWAENGLKKRGLYPKKKKVIHSGKEKKCFDNQVTVIYKFAEGYYPNIKIFRNGNIQMTGIRTHEDGEKMVEIITKEIQKTCDQYPQIVGDITQVLHKDFRIRMINCDFGIPFKIRRKNLHQLLISYTYGNVCSFQPLTYPGVKLQYYWNIQEMNNNGICKCSDPCYGKGNGDGNGKCKKVTVAIFDSGKILITGANSFEQVNAAYAFICKVIMENENELKKNVSLFI
jgi:TATA-box binding protein (TBP) (component of TFIID and TFIIIB)